MRKYVIIDPMWRLVHYIGVRDGDVPQLQRRSRSAFPVRNGDQLHLLSDGEDNPPFSCGNMRPVTGLALVAGADWDNARSSLEEIARATNFNWVRDVNGALVPSNQDNENYVDFILNEFENEIRLPIYRQQIEEFDMGVIFDETCTLAGSRDLLVDRGLDGSLLEPTFCLDCDTGIVSLSYMSHGEKWFIRGAGRYFCVQTSGIAIEVLREALMDDGKLVAVFERIRARMRNDEAGLADAARHAWAYLGNLARQMP